MDKSVILPAPPSDVFHHIRALVADRRDWSLQASDAEARCLTFVAKTGLMRFRDDVDVAVLDAEQGGSALAIYSRSRLGYSDLGANRKRVENIIACLKTVHVKS